MEPFRKDIVLATKLHIGTDISRDADLYALLRKHLEKSMENLRTDYVDLYYYFRT